MSYKYPLLRKGESEITQDIILPQFQSSDIQRRKHTRSRSQRRLCAILKRIPNYNVACVAAQLRYVQSIHESIYSTLLSPKARIFPHADGWIDENPEISLIMIIPWIHQSSSLPRPERIVAHDCPWSVIMMLRV